MSRMPLSPTAPTTATSTSSNMQLFPFQMGSSPTPSQGSQSRAQRTAEARAAFTASLRSAGAHLDSELQARAQDLHANAAALQRQDQDLRSQAQALRDENERLEELVREQRQSLMELGYQTRSEARMGAALGMRDESSTAMDLDLEEAEAAAAAESHYREPWDYDSGAPTDFSSTIIGLGNVSNLDDFLRGVERDLLVLEETCRAVEDGDVFDDLELEPGLERDLEQLQQFEHGFVEESSEHEDATQFTSELAPKQGLDHEYEPEHELHQDLQPDSGHGFEPEHFLEPSLEPEHHHLVVENKVDPVLDVKKDVPEHHNDETEEPPLSFTDQIETTPTVADLPSGLTPIATSEEIPVLLQDKPALDIQMGTLDIHDNRSNDEHVVSASASASISAHPDVVIAPSATPPPLPTTVTIDINTGPVDELPPPQQAQAKVEQQEQQRQEEEPKQAKNETTTEALMPEIQQQSNLEEQKDDGLMAGAEAVVVATAAAAATDPLPSSQVASDDSEMKL